MQAEPCPGVPRMQEAAANAALNRRNRGSPGVEWEGDSWRASRRSWDLSGLGERCSGPGWGISVHPGVRAVSALGRAPEFSTLYHVLPK